MPKQQQVEWKKACYKELESLRQRHVFELTELPPGHKVIKNRWVFDIKTDGCKKARLLAKGFSQVECIDYDEVFSPVVRIMFVLATLSGWHISGLDVKTAFLYGKLDEEIYMKQPEGFKIKGQEHKVMTPPSYLWVEASCTRVVVRTLIKRYGLQSPILRCRHIHLSTQQWQICHHSCMC
jgi:hypothetical protein